MNLPNRNGGSSPPCFLQHFKGRHPDGFMGLQGVRNYDPAIGQWTTPDAYTGEISDPMSQAK